MKQPTLEEICQQYPGDWFSFQEGNDLDMGSCFYNALYQYFLDSGEMPYGIAKARTGDPDVWIADQLERYCI